MVSGWSRFRCRRGITRKSQSNVRVILQNGFARVSSSPRSVNLSSVFHHRLFLIWFIKHLLTSKSFTRTSVKWKYLPLLFSYSVQTTIIYHNMQMRLRSPIQRHGGVNVRSWWEVKRNATRIPMNLGNNLLWNNDSYFSDRLYCYSANMNRQAWSDYDNISSCAD